MEVRDTGKEWENATVTDVGPPVKARGKTVPKKDGWKESFRWDTIKHLDVGGLPDQVSHHFSNYSQ